MDLRREDHEPVSLDLDWGFGECYSVGVQIESSESPFPGERLAVN
jgi:hypothetical protein